MGRMCRMRLAVLAALAGWVGLAEPASALDKVRFGTNWLADPEAGGFYQALADGTYEKFGLDVTIIPGGPQANGGLMLLFGKLEFFMGGDMIGNLLSAEAKLPLVAVAADFQKSPADPHVASGRGLGQMGGSAQGEARLCRRRRNPDFLRLAPARIRLQGRKHHGPTVTIPRLSSKTRCQSSRATSPPSPSRSKGRAVSSQTYSCSPTTAMTPIRH